jgi:hypothetical protein
MARRNGASAGSGTRPIVAAMVSDTTAAVPELRRRLGDIIRPWRGTAYIHLPPEVEPDELELDDLLASDGSRWSRDGEPTVYLACDPLVAVSEMVRHLPTGEEPQPVPRERRLMRFELALPGVVDLREQAALDDLEVTGAPFTFLDQEVARSIADRVRGETAAAGLLVPPMAFLDRSELWNLVVFVDKLPDELGWLRARHDVGRAKVILGT